MIGVIGAMDIEVDYLKSILTDKNIEVHGGIEFHSGKIGNNEVVVAKCGVGKVFSAICAQVMIDFYNPELIINSGIAGTLVKKFSVLDIVVAEKTCQHDMNTTAFGDPMGMISGIGKVFFECDQKVADCLLECVKALGLMGGKGVIASGDLFVSNESVKEGINKKFNADACEMEGGSIGQVCFVNNVPYGVIRAISDGEGATLDYAKFSVIAAENSARVMEEFIKTWD